MKAHRMLKVTVWLLAAAGTLLIALPPAHSMEGITAVYSRASADYVRAMLPDGSRQSEAYAFGEGGYHGAAIRDETIDYMTFADVARAIARPLAGQDYVPAKDPNTTRLLIMVYWGATDGAADFSSLNIASAHGNRGRSRGNGAWDYASVFTGGTWGLGNGWWGSGSTQAAMTDTRNASILGYADELTRFGSAANRERGDLISEVEFSRYFVVLMAYDFQLMWRHNQRKLLWESRFSIREQGNDFTVALPAMAQYAAVYFGRDSHGLLRTRVPDGRIYMGDPTLIEFLTDARK